MDAAFFTIMNLILSGIFIIILLRLTWMLFVSEWNKPLSWLKASRDGAIPRRLRYMACVYPDKVRFFTWWMQIQRIENSGIPGAYAELGVYKGKSARIIHLMSPVRDLFLFDTFSGFDVSDLAIEKGEAATYTTLHFSDTCIQKVQRRIGWSDRVRIVQGHFPESAKPYGELAFAFVNIDADLYNPTREGLNFFYPRLSPGGVIFIHDYNYKWEGVKRAVNEFIQSIPETLIHASDHYGTVMIIKNSNSGIKK